MCIAIVADLCKRLIIKNKKRLKMNKEVGMLLPKKELYNTSGVGKIINYCEDIYIPPYNNTH